jgi:hypothetical protein
LPVVAQWEKIGLHRTNAPIGLPDEPSDGRANA